MRVTGKTTIPNVVFPKINLDEIKKIATNIFKEEDMTATKKLKYAFDLGTNSIGWAIYELNKDSDPISIVKTGVRIFSDGRVPKTGESLAVERRIARESRRRRDRFVRRKKALLKKLIEFGLMPKDKEERNKLKNLDIYCLRDKAVKEKVLAFELGRIFYHLNQRRGFKSNRKENKKEESGKIKPKILKFKEFLAEKTLGEFLYTQHLKKNRLRFTGESDFYPERSLYEDEFDRIVNTQKKFYSDIQEEKWKKLREIIFYQRKLKSKKDSVGLCEVYVDKKRAPRASLYFQRYRLLQDLSNLKTIDEKGLTSEISIEIKKIIYEELSFKEKMTFDQIRRKLKLGKEIKFNLEHAKKKHISGDNLSRQLSEILDEKFSFEELDEIVVTLASDDEDEEVAKKLISLGVKEEYHESLFDLKLEDGYGYLSKEALQYLVPKLEEQYCSPELLIRGLKGEEVKENVQERLRYYGEVLPASVVGGDKTKNRDSDESGYYGKISNPTVHICLNQLRKITNELLDDYGHPDMISLEVTRDLKKSKKERSEIEKKQNENQKQNEKIKDLLIKEHKIEKPSREDILKYRLWVELSPDDVNDRKCPYSLKLIGPSKLFGPEIEIEHILPFSRTLDDSVANKTLAYKNMNVKKANQSPYEAFGANAKYEDVLAYVQQFPANKKWRFLPDAMERFTKDNGFISRQLNDTAYIAKTSRKYLETICRRVDTIPGKLTALVRHQLGLNTILNEENVKGRENHKHHAVDALTIGIISTSFLQKVSRLSENARNEVKIEEPFSNFRNLAQKSIEEIVVSRKEDHGIQARLHEDTYYGIIEPNEYEKENGFNIVTRKGIQNFKENEIETIRAMDIRKRFEKRDFETVIEELKKEGTKKLRFLKKDQSIQKITHPHLTPLHAKGVIPGDNHSLEVWKIPKHTDKNTGKTVGEKLHFVVYSFYERAKKISKRPHPAAKKLFTLHKGDNVIMKDNGDLKIMNVKTIKPSNNLVGVVSIDSSTRADKEAKWPTFNSFFAKEIRPVKITASGKILDPGNPYV